MFMADYKIMDLGMDRLLLPVVLMLVTGIALAMVMVLEY
jgi:ribosomal protein S12 methylthiotransferase accessory factor YcaO